MALRLEPARCNDYLETCFEGARKAGGAIRAALRLLPSLGQEHVIAEADGTMICTVKPGNRKGKRPREWKEMRLVATQAKGRATTVYGATFGSVEQTALRWGHCARDAGWGLNSHIHVVGDGAEWIRLQSLEVFGKQGSFLCDFFHVSEYLGAAAPNLPPCQTRSVAAYATEAVATGCRPKSNRGIGRALGTYRDTRRASSRAQRASLLEQSTGVLGLSTRLESGIANRLGHDRERSPPCASSQTQESRHRLASKSC